MNSKSNLVERLRGHFQEGGVVYTESLGEVTMVLPRQQLATVAPVLRDSLRFDVLVDLCGVDYSAYRGGGWDKGRFAVVYHLLSVARNERLRLKVYLEEDSPVIDSVVAVWASASWYERETFDMFGIIFDGHPDLRRILTDYGFIGHPFRKDFPLMGHVEMRYDPQQGRVIYEPVTVEPRELVPRVIREDHRYEDLKRDR